NPPLRGDTCQPGSHRTLAPKIERAEAVAAGGHGLGAAAISGREEPPPPPTNIEVTLLRDGQCDRADPAGSYLREPMDCAPGAALSRPPSISVVSRQPAELRFLRP